MRQLGSSSPAHNSHHFNLNKSVNAKMPTTVRAAGIYFIELIKIRFQFSRSHIQKAIQFRR